MFRSALQRQKCSRIIGLPCLNCLRWREEAGGDGMRRVSMAMRGELLQTVSRRYCRSARVEKSRILDEYAATAGSHLIHVVLLVRTGSFDERSAPPLARR